MAAAIIGQSNEQNCPKRNCTFDALHVDSILRSDQKLKDDSFEKLPQTLLMFTGDCGGD